MSTRDNGGPAFPLLNPKIGYHADIIQQAEGLSVRDWFAAHAPEPSQDYLDMEYQLDRHRNPHNDPHKPQSRSPLQIKAQYRFAYADAMLAARKGGAA